MSLVESEDNAAQLIRRKFWEVLISACGLVLVHAGDSNWLLEPMLDFPEAGIQTAVLGQIRYPRDCQIKIEADSPHIFCTHMSLNDCL